MAPADVLLLDEPTNHLDLETTGWLEEYLARLDATVLLISHDRAFLQAVVDHVLHVEAGTAHVYTGELRGVRPPAHRAPADPAAAFEKQQRSSPRKRTTSGATSPGRTASRPRAPAQAARSGCRAEPTAGRGRRHVAPARRRRAGRRPGARGRQRARARRRRDGRCSGLHRPGERGDVVA